jgi:hypothetical protein
LSPSIVPLVVPNFDAASAANNWAAALGQSSAKAQAGAQRVRTSPGALAAQNAQKWINRVNESAGKWARKVGAVTLAEWQQAYITKGVPRIASGAQAAQPKYQAALVPLFQYMQGVWDQVNAMPSDTPQQRDQKMLQWAAQMRNYQGTA